MCFGLLHFSCFYEVMFGIWNTHNHKQKYHIVGTVPESTTLFMFMYFICIN